MKDRIRLVKTSRILLWLIFLGIVLSGLTLVAFLPANDDELPHPLSGLFREIHGAFSVLVIFMLGFMTRDHIINKIRFFARYPDGIVHLLLWVFLVLSGYWLYYPSDFLSEKMDMRYWHWLTGLLLTALFPLHVLRKTLLNRFANL